VINPLFVPEDPDWIESQEEPEATEAVQFMVPEPALTTSNVAVPAEGVAGQYSGVTLSIPV